MLREGHRLRVFENRFLRGAFVPMRCLQPGTGEDHIMMSFMICTRHQLLSW